MDKKVFFGGSIITMNDNLPTVQAVGIEGEKISAVGSLGEVKGTMGENCDLIDLNNCALLPGFIDSHLHPIAFLFFLFNLDLKNVKSIKELNELLKNSVINKPNDELIVGLSLKEEDFEDPKERILPTRWVLDEACPNHPVFLLRYDAHIGIANTRALELAGITKDTNAPEGGEIRKDEKGELTGVLSELATSLVLTMITPPSREIIDNAAKEGFNIFASKGLTSLQGVIQAEAGAEMGDAGAFELPFLKSLVGIIPQSFYCLVFTSNPKKLKRLQKAPIHGDSEESQFKIGCLKLFADGTYGSATALMHKPFSDQHDKTGFLVTSENELYEKMKIAHNLGFQIGIHAIGDKGNRLVVNLYKKLLSEFPRDNHRHRIEHASTLTPDVIQDIKDLNLIASCQPPFINSEYKWLPKRLGEERCKHVYPMKSLLDAGIIIASGSDCPIEDPDVVMGLHALVTRNGFVPEESLSMKDALKTYTINGAYAAFEENVKGSIEVGKLADFVILDKNPLEVPEDEIKDLQVLETVIRGKTVYKKE